MDFKTLRENCKHEHPGYNDDHQLEFTCRHKDNTPPGHSWGPCDEAHCPILKSKKRVVVIIGEKRIDTEALVKRYFEEMRKKDHGSA